jgi:hypothetical protein
MRGAQLSSPPALGAPVGFRALLAVVVNILEAVMVRSSFHYLFLAGIFGLVAVVSGQGFELKLQLQRAHLGEIFLGRQDGATSDYDRGIDIFAPPPGMQTGYVGFTSPNPKLPLLYKDIRNLDLPQEWKLYCKPEGNQAIVLSWSPDSIPEGLALTIKQDDRVFDMRTVKRMEVKKTTTLLIELKKAP